jgi:hypothetical protein
MYRLTMPRETLIVYALGALNEAPFLLENGPMD